MRQAVEHTPTTIHTQKTDGAFLPVPSRSFVQTPEVQRTTARALAYMDAGYPVHFSGVAGTGKTSLAFHVAAQLDQPAVLLHGDDEFGRSDLVGGEVGYRKSKVVDNFIRSVLKTDEQVKRLWEDNRLATACRKGYTLIYDEFTRSRAEANNVLLSILEERILNLPSRAGEGTGYIRVHPNFRAIFTSNTEEYAGTHKSQNALLDRLITIQLEFQSRSAEVDIVQSRAGISETDAACIVDIVRTLREARLLKRGPSIRPAIALARIFADRTEAIDASNALFRAACVDVLRPSRRSLLTDPSADVASHIHDAVETVLRSAGR
ncbi:gas vesicle protein GvpN [Salisaeta longa]|uniref:gas vesicle protein GvpN n=1 Tax=Salisaeta longa TaxID=503170 RepID=UPI0003B6EBA7|nr:gas vesicle protein GvpN [Salisaeta longa]